MKGLRLSPVSDWATDTNLSLMAQFYSQTVFTRGLSSDQAYQITPVVVCVM